MFFNNATKCFAMLFHTFLEKDPTQSQLAMSGEATQAYIVGLDIIFNKCGTNFNTPLACVIPDSHVER